MLYFLFFIILLQCGALFVIWRVFQMHKSQMYSKFRMLDKEHHEVDPVIDTLRIVVEKLSDRLNQESESLKSQIGLSHVRIQHLEKFTSKANGTSFNKKENNFSRSNIFEKLDAEDGFL